MLLRPVSERCQGVTQLRPLSNIRGRDTALALFTAGFSSS
jgi:hypothetical protein